MLSKTADVRTKVSMEPRSFDRGDPKLRLPLESRLFTVSMEPRSFDRGDPLLDRHDGKDPRQVSMEPRSFDRGDLDTVCKVLTGGHVSMEPRSFDRGDLLHRMGFQRDSARFQWSRGPSTAET